jgi:hypothetical protein
MMISISVKVAIYALKETVIIFVLNVYYCSSTMQPSWSRYESSSSAEAISIPNEPELKG